MKKLALLLLSLIFVTPLFAEQEQTFIDAYAKKFEKKLPKLERITNGILSKLPLEGNWRDYDKLYIPELIIRKDPPKEGATPELLLTYLLDAKIYYEDCAIFSDGKFVGVVEKWFVNAGPSFSYADGKMEKIIKYKKLRRYRLIHEPRIERYEAIFSIAPDYTFTVGGGLFLYGTFVIKDDKVSVVVDLDHLDEVYENPHMKKESPVENIKAVSKHIYGKYYLIPIDNYIEFYDEFHPVAGDISGIFNGRPNIEMKG